MHEQLESFNRGMSDAFDDIADGEPLSLAAVRTCEGPYWRGYERAIQQRYAFQRSGGMIPRTDLGTARALTLWERARRRWAELCRRAENSLVAYPGDPRVSQAQFEDNYDCQRPSPAPLFIALGVIVGLLALVFFWR